MAAPVRNPRRPGLGGDNTSVGSARRSFVVRHTALQPVPGVTGIRLHLADEVYPLWHALQVETGDPDTPMPYWAFAWGGGLAIARYQAEHPEVVDGRHVLDLAAGSGLCAIAALRAGAASVTAADIDPFAVEAIALNAKANGVRIQTTDRDLLAEPPPDVDVILAGDCWYEESLAARVLPWLRAARDLGIDVITGDPGRRYLPTGELVEVAVYDVRTTTELEDLALKQGRVFRIRGGRDGARGTMAVP
jgi:predicted nicotinamide N-methyase